MIIGFDPSTQYVAGNPVWFWGMVTGFPSGASSGSPLASGWTNLQEGFIGAFLANTVAPLADKAICYDMQVFGMSAFHSFRIHSPNAVTGAQTWEVTKIWRGMRCGTSFAKLPDLVIPNSGTDSNSITSEMVEDAIAIVITGMIGLQVESYTIRIRRWVI